MKIKRNLITLIVIIGIVLIGTGIYVSNINTIEALNTFKIIPEKPEDFEAVKREVYAGTLSMCKLNESYYKQPDFFPSWEHAEKYYNSYDWSHWGRHGYTAFPVSLTYSVENMKAGDTIDLCSFFANGWVIWTWQGFELKPIDNEYFDVQITPNLFTLDPTFPVIGNDFVKKIHVTITAKKDIPAGNYVVGYTEISPQSNYNFNQTEQILSQKIEDKPRWVKECVRILNDEEKCTDLVNKREKSYSIGGQYKVDNLPLTVNIVAR